MEQKDIETQKEDMSKTEVAFESTLWGGRWMVLIAVIGGMFTSTAMFVVAGADVIHLVDLIYEYITTHEIHAREALRGNVVGHIVEVIDGFLLAIVLLIFSFGIYELYVSKIDKAYEQGIAHKHLLSISCLDDLKARLGKVILMILIVKFFEMALSVHFTTMDDLLKFSGGVLLIAIAIFSNQLLDGLAKKSN